MELEADANPGTLPRQLAPGMAGLRRNRGVGARASSERGEPVAFVVYDLEYTSWEGAHARNWSGPGEHREIVQIGAVRLDGGAGLAELACFEAIVVPRVNPRLSRYFVELTGIDEARLAREGLDFAAALARFSGFAEGAGGLLANGDDEDVLRENCRLCGLAWPFADGFCRNLAPVLQAAAGGARHIVSSRLPEIFRLAPAGRAHDGLADARAIAAALRVIQERRAGRPGLERILAA